jgi:hypothetical protein
MEDEGCHECGVGWRGVALWDLGPVVMWENDVGPAVAVGLKGKAQRRRQPLGAGGYGSSEPTGPQQTTGTCSIPPAAEWRS